MTDRRNKLQAKREDGEPIDIWIIGGGVASLAAAVFLIKDANVLPTHIHMFDVHSALGGGLTGYGNPEKGYVLHPGQTISYHDSCVEKLLLQAPSTHPGATPWEKQIAQKAEERRHARRLTRAIVPGQSGPEKLDSQRLGLNLQDRLGLIRVMLENEHALGRKRVCDVFDGDFFSTKFWMIWSTTFAFTPHHSAVELRRYLRKYLHDIGNSGKLSGPDEIRNSQHESIIQPISKYLREEGVDFRLNERVVDVLTYPDGDPTTVSEIKFLGPDGSEKMVTLDPSDLVFVTLGSVGSGTVMGDNVSAPGQPSMKASANEWALWDKLAGRSIKFGNPSNFCNTPANSTLGTFTVTLYDSEFFDRIQEITGLAPGSQPVLSLPKSNWEISLNTPHQPVYHTQPDTVKVFAGWALHPEKNGNYVKKTMMECTGAEVLQEILRQLDFPETLLSQAVTIPCISPLATSALLPRSHNERPEVIPHDTTNLALLGQFVEIADEPSLTMEYSVQSAQLAVDYFMGVKKESRRSWRNHFVEMLDLLT
ncbi:67 kDa myosin-cross-reactive antigen family protein [Paecilomyces variotii No. 5]|uniref:67 kDa myosin-cross-reactive antigen family protein n=1 Tax=Byssochlamys spectabilis (strain No. 5 / NBRC 109023) TaxID=1356009 RepID=V5FYK8_BYSSN|nr:67 kDa myosin-cross-reactive antigen family protein [Paecilomyces variotii No. 5]